MKSKTKNKKRKDFDSFYQAYCKFRKNFNDDINKNEEIKTYRKLNNRLLVFLVVAFVILVILICGYVKSKLIHPILLIIDVILAVAAVRYLVRINSITKMVDIGKIESNYRNGFYKILDDYNIKSDDHVLLNRLITYAEYKKDVCESTKKIYLFLSKDEVESLLFNTILLNPTITKLPVIGNIIEIKQTLFPKKDYLLDQLIIDLKKYCLTMRINAKF